MNRVRTYRAGGFRAPAIAGVLLLLVTLVSACGSSSGKASQATSGVTVRLLTHDAFAASKSVLADFTKQTGIKVKVLRQGDAGAMVNAAILTRDDPEADALYGIDNTFLSRALDHQLFEPRNYTGLDLLIPQARASFASALKYVVPTDWGDVCFNYDIAWFRNHHLAAPTTLDDLVKPAYKGLTVVENPATSSTGNAMLVSSVAKFGDKGAMTWWHTLLHKNGGEAVDSWDTAYESDFTDGGGSGTRPIVLSYASSPPADIVYSDGKKTTTDVGVVMDGCFRQYEFAGVLHNAAHPAAAQILVQYLLSKEFQQDMPSQMFVFPTRTGAAIPAVFQKWAPPAPHPYLPDYRTIGAHRDQWIDEWTKDALG
ncbi:MAG TPA: thiamine ABC transporter substrate-binding protein [Acidimicrobiia bacterium]